MPMTLPQNYDTNKFTLQAVNIMLQAINEIPLDDAIDLEHVEEAKIAMAVLDETAMEVLAEGWDFNTDEGYEFPPDQDGFINIPATVLDISANNGTIQMRGWKLYDTVKRTTKFTEIVKCNVKWNLEFNELTHPIRNFITLRAARKFQARQVGDPTMHQALSQEESEAYLSARRSETMTGGFNMLNGSYGQDNLAY